ncbi:hypothetical protein [Bacillus sp. XF8]|uniref:hypothetical protein n=1 Tax=Bacillus sp. XF8 TaxID=2819289 RepID=UPI001AA04F29|nr:hypothetical protein [Bacillus sp. XF8]MBO1579088.1 hypothetical protein [Bacillus sp. XF8]
MSQFSGLLSSSSFSEVAHAEENGTAGEILANLTQEQHDALTKLRSLNETGLHLTPEVNVESTDEISVIVEFKQKPYQVAVLEAAAEGKQQKHLM